MLMLCLSLSWFAEVLLCCSPFLRQAAHLIEMSRRYWAVHMVWRVHRSGIPERRRMDDTKEAT
jgi:hypothetical protein